MDAIHTIECWKKITHSYKKCADHKRYPKGIGNPIKKAKARNKRRRGNIYILEKTWWKTKWGKPNINRLDIDKNYKEDSSIHRHGAESISGKQNTTKKDIRTGRKHTQYTVIGEKALYVRVKRRCNKNYGHKGRLRAVEGNIGWAKHK